MPATSLPPSDGASPTARAADVLTAPSNALGAANRARMMSGMQQTVGNSRVGRMLGTTAAPTTPPPALAPTPRPPTPVATAAPSPAAPKPTPTPAPASPTAGVPALATAAAASPAVVAPPVPPSGVKAPAAPGAPSTPAAPKAEIKPQARAAAAKSAAPEKGLAATAAPEKAAAAGGAAAAPASASAKGGKAAPAAGGAAPAPAGAPSKAAKAAPAVGGAEGKARDGQSGAPNALAAIAPAVAAVHHRAAGARKHSAPTVPVASAQAAARAQNPRKEQERSAATQTVANLDEAKAEEVKRDDFKAKLKEAIEKATPKPKTESEADDVMKNGAEKASGTLRSTLATERDAAAGSMKSAVATEVPPSSQPAPPDAKPQPEPVGRPPAPVSAAPVVPAPLPPERLDYSADRGPTDNVMAENNVTQNQMQEANDPAFGPALQARSTAEKHEATAEAKYRQGESKVQDQAHAAAAIVLTKGLGGMHSAREQQIGKVVSQQLGTQAEDAKERQRITDTITSIKNNTRSGFDEILKSMEEGAGEIFEAGLQRAEKAYEHTFKEAKGGTWTWLTTWGSDWEELIENSLAKARAEYLHQVDLAIDQVATFVDAKLKAAHQRVADGRKEVKGFVDGLEHRVIQFGEEALQAVSADFDAMGSEIDQRRDGLINKLTEQYKASYQRMSALEEKLREENKSLWQRVYDATVGLIKKIIEFTHMLLSALAKVAEVVVDIIAHPIRFLENLVSSVMQGLKNFMSKLDTYLLKGIMDWLFGALAGSGLQLPDKFDLQGIISIVLQILGLTYANFRARAVGIVGEPVVAEIEKTAEVFKVILTEGVPGLWRFIQEQLADLKSMVLDAIFGYIKEKVIMAGITWIIGLLNPVSAFFKACKAIYDIVMFFISHGKQILDLVNAVIDSIAAIVKGSTDVAAGLVENALAKTIPVAIGFLASLLGLGDPSKPVREFIEKARTPVNKAIDWAINLAVKGVKAAGALVGLGKKKEESPKTNDLEHDAKVNAGLLALREEEKKHLHNGKISRRDALAVAKLVRSRHPIFKSITVIDGGDRWNYRYVASEGLEEGPPKEVTIGDIKFLIFRAPGASIRIQLPETDDEVVIKARATKAAQIEALVKTLELDENIARALVQKLPPSDLDAAHNLLLQFSREKGKMPPDEFIIAQLKANRGTSAAFAQPPSRERRALGVNLGVEERGGAQREPLSKFALVFRPFFGEWEPRPHPEAGGMEFIYQGKGQPDVVALGAIEVDDLGRVVRILEVSSKLRGGQTRLIELMKVAGWTIAL